MSDSDHLFEDALTEALTSLDLSFEPAQLAACRTHFEHVVKANEIMNLTRITEPKEAAVKHYADSLAVIRWVVEREAGIRTVLDVGTGAGYPAVPLAVARREWSVTALDATAKKVAMLRSTGVDMGLSNLECIHAHSNHWKSGRTFDLVVTRALAAFPRALKETAAFVTEGGWFVAYKTATIEPAEEEAAAKASAKYGLELQERYAYNLDCGGDTLNRVLYVFRKKG